MSDESYDARTSPTSSAVRRHEWPIVGSLAILAVGLGYVGLRQVYTDQGYGPTELVYRALQLFVLESGAVNADSVPVTLEIARILAPAVAAYAAVRAVLTLFREQLALLGLRFGLRDHVIVVGLGATGARLARAFRADGRRVVVIENERLAAGAPDARRHGIHVVSGDAADPAVLADARLSRARYLVVATGNDRRNVDIAFSAAAASSRVRGAGTAFVHLDDLALWRRLQAQILAASVRPSLRLEFFNVTESAARRLVERHRPFDGDRSADDGLLVVGTGPLARSAVVAAARAWQLRGRLPERLPITLAGPDAPAHEAALRREHPALERLAAFASWPLEAARLDGELAAAPDPPAFHTTYVCEEDEAAGLAAALALSERREAGRVVLAVDDEAVGVGRALGSPVVRGRLELFGVGSTLTPSLLAEGVNEILARAKHAHYVECERERGAARANRSLVDWDVLDESLKESNRLFADSIGRKLELAGCALVPAPLSDREPSFAFSAEEIEELARAEHDRWCADLWNEGWRWGRRKDSERRLHPSLVPWSELSDEEREKDREPVRELPRMLALVGFEIQRARTRPGRLVGDAADAAPAREAAVPRR